MDFGRNRSAELKKRRQRMMAATYSSSEDDDNSDLNSSSDDNKKKKSSKKKPTVTKAAAAAAARKKSSCSSDDDSDSSIDFLGTGPRKNPTRKARSPQKKPAAAARKRGGSPAKKSNARSSLDTLETLSSGDDDDTSIDLPNTITATGKRTSPRKQSPATAASSRKPPPETAHHDPSVRKASNKALDDARKAREALKAAQQYKAKEVEEPPETIDIDDDIPSSPEPIEMMPSRPAAVAPAPPAVSTYSGTPIHLTLRYQNPTTNKESKVNIKIKTDQPIQHLVDQFKVKQQQNGGNLQVTTLKFDGENMILSRTPIDYEMEDEDLVDAVVANAAPAASGPSIKLKFRVYGKTNDVTTLSIRMKGQFQYVMTKFAEKKSVALSQCKFIFDGEALPPNGTPEGLDLEGNEIIDVKIPEVGAGVANATTSAATSAAISAAISAATSAARASASAVVTPPAKISIQTNRNVSHLPATATA